MITAMAAIAASDAATPSGNSDPFSTIFQPVGSQTPLIVTTTMFLIAWAINLDRCPPPPSHAAIGVFRQRAPFAHVHLRQPTFTYANPLSLMPNCFWVR